MKKLNKKGFTLIELLAVIIILGVLLLIAVPSVSKYITESRQKTYTTNLSRMVDAVVTEVNAYSSDYQFSSNQYLVVPVVALDLEKGSNTKSPFGNYELLSTFITVRRVKDGNTYKYEYEVSALDNSGYGINLTDSDVLTENPLAVTGIGTNSNALTISRAGTDPNYTYTCGFVNKEYDIDGDGTKETYTPKVVGCSKLGAALTDAGYTFN